MNIGKITDLKARQILDSRGNPTVEVDLTVDDEFIGRASVPSGASTGTHEALELRDDDKDVYGGKGVEEAVKNVESDIKDEILGKSFANVAELDAVLISLDGTENKSNLGANAILGVSMAFTVAMAKSQGLPLYEYIAQMTGNTPLLPRPMFNILNGGAHANWSTDIQEFMVIPLGKRSFAQMLQVGSEVFHSLEDLLKKEKLSVNVGNEGGFAPELSHNQEALDLIIKAIENAGYTPGTDVGIGLDIAASEFFVANQEGEDDDEYELKTEHRTVSRSEWIEQIGKWVDKYPIISIEDPLSEDAWMSWHEFLESEGNDLEQVVGDDLLVTNPDRIRKAIDQESCNALLVKLNQIGSVSETIEAMNMAREAGWKLVISHRSGETEDTFISHLAVGTAAGQMKSGAPSRGERTAKYNELLRIEEQIRGD